MMLPVPRLMILDSDQISKFVGVVTDGFTVPVCFQASGAILKDIQESSKPFTDKEYRCWIDKLYMAALQNTRGMGDAIDSVKNVLKQWREDLDMVIHNRALSFCLKNKDSDEFEVQLKNLQAGQISPNRETLTLMMKYATETENINCLLNVLLDFVIKGKNGLTCCFFPDDYATLFRCLILLNQSDLAFFILNELSDTRTNYRKFIENKYGIEGLQIFDAPDSLTEEYKATSYGYDYVMKNQSMIDWCPTFTPNMLEPFFVTIASNDDLSDLEKMMNQMSEEHQKISFFLCMDILNVKNPSKIFFFSLCLKSFEAAS
ncbi:unnamed protein product [Ambrosiozyma monospora]|uniref:Unnamed protein product n=1 Tax=Ambrosiozyma monospora TaxID=43982 RepID=A0ACB5TDN3_AMBMO|nr:unnamed protein product [Ambrosiozyma monospora]